MTVRIVPRGAPQRTDLYDGVIAPIVCDGLLLYLHRHGTTTVRAIPLCVVAEILMDEEPGDWW